MSYPQWRHVNAIASDRPALSSTRLLAAAIDSVTGELLESTVFTPNKDRLGAYLWPKDFGEHINKKLKYIRCGESDANGFTVLESGYRNFLWVAPGVRLMVSHLNPVYWESVASIVGSEDLTANHLVTLKVCDKLTGTVYERLSFAPGVMTKAAWPFAVATWINKNSLYVAAGRARTVELPAGTVDVNPMFAPLESENGNSIWARKGAELSVSLSVDKWIEAGQIRSDRAAPPGQRITAVVIDSSSDEILESTTFTPPAAHRGYSSWPKLFADHINANLKRVRAGKFDSTDPGTTWSTYSNKLWVSEPGLRVFTTALHADDWESVASISGAALTMQSVVTVQTCSALSGKVIEVLTFVPSSSRLASKDWAQDLAKHINATSLYLRAGRAYKENELNATALQTAGNNSDLCYPSQETNLFWLPKGSGLTVKWQVGTWAKTAIGLDSDRAALGGRSIRTMVIDTETEELLEKIPFIPKSGRLGYQQWPKDCADHVNASSRYVRIGEKDSTGVISGLEHHANNYLWNAPGVRSFTTGCWHPGYWEQIGAINGGTLDLKAVICVSVCSRLTGRVYETLTFTPQKDHLAVWQWAQDLAKHINAHSEFIRAGRQYTAAEVDASKLKADGNELFYPTGNGSGSNIIWAPKGSLLTVEIQGDSFQVPTPAPAIAYQVEVDNFSGVYSCKVPMGTVVGNNGAGPAFEVVLDVSRKRAELIVSSIFEVNNISLNNKLYKKVFLRTSRGIYHVFECGETEKIFNLGDVNLSKSKDFWLIEYKDGGCEYLKGVRSFMHHLDGINTHSELFSLPYRIEDESGKGLSLEWGSSQIELTPDGESKGGTRIVAPVMALLKSIIDDGGSKLLSGTFSKNATALTLFPERNDLKVAWDIQFNDYDFEEQYAAGSDDQEDKCFGTGLPKRITATYSDNSSASLAFVFKSANLAQVQCGDPGTKDVLSCTNDGRVTKQVQSSPGMPDRTISFSYDAGARKTVRTCESGPWGWKMTEEFHYEAKVNRLTRHVLKIGEYEVSKGYTYTTDTSGSMKIELKTTYTQGTKTRSETSSMTLDKNGNPVKREQDGFITEWTYYRGDPTIKEKTVASKRVDKQTSGMGLVFGWAIDFINPVGWVNNIFNDKGLTWGTDYEREKYFAPRQTKHAKETFGLPQEITYPGDMQFFTRHVESERVYTLKDNTRVDLCWTFYSYSKLEHFKGADKPVSMVLHNKLIFRDPVSADHKKMDKYAAGERQTYLYNNDRTNVGCYGKVASIETVLIDNKGKDVANSTRKDTYWSANEKTDQATSIKYPNVVEEQTTVAGRLGRVMRDAQSGNPRREYNNGSGPDRDYSYDAYGRLSMLRCLTKDAGGVLQFYSFGYYRQMDRNLEVVVSSSGRSMRNIYNLSGQLLQEQILISEVAGWRTLKSFEYTSQGKPTVILEHDYSADGRPIARTLHRLDYDTWGREVGLTVNGRKEVHRYCPIDLTLTEYAQNSAGAVTGGKSVTHYNENGTVSSVVHQNASGTQLSKQSYLYNSKTEVSKLSSTLNGDIEFAYDAYGRTTLVKQNGVQYKNVYPAHTKVANASSASMEWKDGSADKSLVLGKQSMDLYGRLTAFEAGTLKQTYTYKGAARLGHAGIDAKATAMGQPTTQDFDMDDRILRISESFSGQVSGSALLTSSQYSLLGRLLCVSDAFGHRTHYHYSAQGIYSGQSNGQMRSWVTRNAHGFVTEEVTRAIDSGQTITTAYTYDAIARETERRISVTGFDDLIIQRTYDSKGRLQKSLIQQGSGKTVIRDETYEYAAGGGLSKYVCSGSSKPHLMGLELQEQTFRQDAGGGLASATSKLTKSAYGTANMVNTWSYAGTGVSAEELNELTLKREGRTTGTVMSCTNDSSGRLQAMKWKSEGTTTFGDFKLAYCGNGRLHQIEDVQNGYTTAYTYDTFGKLVGRKDSNYTVDVLYQRDTPYAQIRQKHADNTVQKLILLNRSDSCELQRIDASTAGRATGSQYSLEVKDAHGSVIASYDLGNNSVEFHAYTPYGERKTSHDDRSWRGFNGEVLDPQLGGIYHLGNGYRVYSPLLTHFLSRDRQSPFGVGGANGYAYCNGDPVNYCDPDGHQVIGRYTHSEKAYFTDPLVEALVTGVIGLAMGGIGGFSSFGVLGALVSTGLGGASMGLGIGALYVGKTNSDLAGVMGMFAFALDFDGSFGSVNSGSIGRGGGMRSARRLDMPANPGVTRNNYKASGTGSFTYKSQCGVDLFVIHSHPKNKHLMIDAHGYPLGRQDFDDGSLPSQTFSTPVTPEIGFYADAGFTTSFPGNYKKMLEGGMVPKNFYQGKYPNYLLMELTPEFVAREFKCSLTDAKLLKQDIADMVKAGKTDMDYLTPLRMVTMEQVFEILEREGFNYQLVSAMHCRGVIHHAKGPVRWRNALKKHYLQQEMTQGLNVITMD